MNNHIIRFRRSGGWADSSGSISLEAAMVLPWVIMMTFLLLLFALYISQGALLYYSTSIMAERTAFGWSNSAKDVRTGAYSEGQYDSLYWRLTDDSLVQGLFGLASEEHAASIEIKLEMIGSSGSSAQDKLKKSGFDTAVSHRVGTGELSYRNIGIKREVEAKLTSVWRVEPLIWLRGRGVAEAEASALIVEPVEFLRTFDLVRYYASKMKKAPGGATAYRDKAGDVLQKRKL